MLNIPLAMKQHQFFRLGDCVDLLDPGPGSPGDGLSSVMPRWGVPEEPKIKMLHSTTILCFKLLHGVIVAADYLATAGAYIAPQTVKKAIEIDPYLLGTRAVGAANCRFWDRSLAQQ